MTRPTLKQINDFIDSHPIAIVGVSRNSRKFGYTAFRELKEKGMQVVPVNPFADTIMGEKTYPDISELPQEIRSIVILTKKDQTAKVVKSAKEKGIKKIWIQQMSETGEALGELADSDIDYITGECILMHYKPHGVHKFHRSLRKFFGRFPK